MSVGAKVCASKVLGFCVGGTYDAGTINIGSASLAQAAANNTGRGAAASRGIAEARSLLAASGYGY